MLWRSLSVSHTTHGRCALRRGALVSALVSSLYGRTSSACYSNTHMVCHSVLASIRLLPFWLSRYESPLIMPGGRCDAAQGHRLGSATHCAHICDTFWRIAYKGSSREMLYGSFEDTPFSGGRSHWLGGADARVHSMKFTSPLSLFEPGTRNVNEEACYHWKAIRANWFLTKRMERFMVFSLIFWIFVRQQIKIQRSHILAKLPFVQLYAAAYRTVRSSHVWTGNGILWMAVRWATVKVHTNRWRHRYDRVESATFDCHSPFARSSPVRLHGWGLKKIPILSHHFSAISSRYLHIVSSSSAYTTGPPDGGPSECLTLRLPADLKHSKFEFRTTPNVNQILDQIMV